MRILLIEDEKNIAGFLKLGLKQEGFAVDDTGDGKKGLFMATTNEYDLIILDIMLPKMNGREICSKIRKDGKNYPIIILTSNVELDNKIDFLNIGADDYLTKPFSFDELIARMKVILRRPREIENNIYKIGDLFLDENQRVVRKGNKVITLTLKEYSLLKYLFINKNKVVSKNILLEHVWDVNANPFSKTLETHIRNLRFKLNEKKKYIHTVSGVGYCLRVDE